MVYLAKVDNAATSGTTGLKWFKVAEQGLDRGKWAVDAMIANNGWHYFTTAHLSSLRATTSCESNSSPSTAPTNRARLNSIWNALQ